MAAHGAFMSAPPCRHCNTPDPKRQCRYYWWLPFADDWKKSGADRPCDADRYAEDLERADSQLRRKISLAIVALVALVIWGLAR